MVPNHGYVNMSDVGSTDITALNCHTNHPDPHSRGDWISPDGTRVSGGTVPGFRITQSPILVRLLRTSDTPQEGIYQCIIEYGVTTFRAYIGLYNSRRGWDTKNGHQLYIHVSIYYGIHYH